MKNNLGIALFCIGLIVGISGAAKAPEELGAWPDTWPVFVFGSVVCAIGLVLWRMAIAERKAQEVNVASDQDPVALLSALMEPLQAVSDTLDTLDERRLGDKIDELLEGYILPFAEVRRRIIDRFGMEKGAEILVVVAYGERLLNRVWSASADGHIIEARSCFPEAYSAFIEANRLIEEAKAA